jgi:SAM-dependent methyltransferase
MMEPQNRTGAAPSLWGFGSLPDDRAGQGLIARLRGVPNLIKRLQGRTIIRHVAPAPGERVLDFGCGAGFLAVECARAGAEATGVDIARFSKSEYRFGAGRLEFVTIQPGQRLPFEDDTFDKAIMSEVIIVLPDPAAALREIHRVLKPSGRIFVVNTLGRLQIKEAYQRNALLLRAARAMYPRTPGSYEEFCARFLRDADGLQRTRWFSEEQLVSFVASSGFRIAAVDRPFKAPGLEFVYWRQFFKLCRVNQVGIPFGLPKYLMLELMNWLSPRRDPSNIIITGIKP